MRKMFFLFSVIFSVFITVNAEANNQVHGYITYTSSGAPVSGAVVEIYNPSGTLMASGTTNSSGYYTISMGWVADGNYYLVATKDTHFSHYCNYTGFYYTAPWEAVNLDIEETEIDCHDGWY